MKRCDRTLGGVLATILALGGCTGTAISTPQVSSAPPIPLANLIGETLTSASPTASCRAHYTPTSFYVAIRFAAQGAASGPAPGTFTTRGFIALSGSVSTGSATFLSFDERFIVSSGGFHIHGRAHTKQALLMQPACYPSGNHITVTGSQYRVNGETAPGTTILTVGTSPFTQTFQ